MQTPKPAEARVRAVALAALCLAVAACGAKGEREEIAETRQLAEPRPEQAVVADARMRLTPPSMNSSGSPHGMPSTNSAGSLAWDLPNGWRTVTPKPPVTASFAVPGRDGIDVSITVLPGPAGGLLANMNRWRKQMSLPDISEADVAALPRVKVFGADAPYLQMNGTFKGAAGSTMAAVAVEHAGASVFVKMVGPSEDVADVLDRFRALCSSLRDVAGAAAPMDDEPEASPIKWTAPKGWTQGPAKQMRLVTFNPTGAPSVECYVTVLGGAAGGLAANVNRWREQLHLAPLSAEAIAALPAIPALGSTAHMVEIDGGAVGMYGLVCELGAQTVFVKMTGPMDALRAERERFIEFCKSLT